MLSLFPVNRPVLARVRALKKTSYFYYYNIGIPFIASSHRWAETLKFLPRWNCQKVETRRILLAPRQNRIFLSSLHETLHTDGNTTQKIAQVQLLQREIHESHPRRWKRNATLCDVLRLVARRPRFETDLSLLRGVLYCNSRNVLESVFGLLVQIRTFQWSQNVVLKGVRSGRDGRYKTCKCTKVSANVNPARSNVARRSSRTILKFPLPSTTAFIYMKVTFGFYLVGFSTRHAVEWRQRREGNTSRRNY